MSYDGNGKPGKGPGATATSLNGMSFAVARATKRIACNASQQGVGIGEDSHESVQSLLDAKRHQRSSGAVKTARAKADHR